MSSADRPHGSGDGWVELADGRRFWGRAGAAGLLAVTPGGAVLLQHRVEWSHFGGTWGLPGGARHLGESALEAALREAHEETGIDGAALTPRFTVLLDLGGWSYATVAVDAPAELAVAVSDRESTALRWVPADEVDALPLHPGFAEAWPRLRGLLDVRDTLVVDVANVVGSRPDGWWRDRRGASSRFLALLAERARSGFDVDDDGTLPVVARWPQVVAVLEGEARGAAAPEPVEAVPAAADGDSAIVAEVERLTGQGRRVTVVTADRALRDRVSAQGARVVGPGRLLDQLG